MSDVGILRITVGVAVLCSAAVCRNTVPDRVPDGTWGGEHISMVVTDTGATIEYDCASGRITVPLALDANGDFTWTGIHSPGHGGPIRVGEPPDDRPARYTGSATTTAMRITLTVVDGSVPPQAFVLARGGAGRVFKCL